MIFSVLNRPRAKIVFDIESRQRMAHANIVKAERHPGTDYANTRLFRACLHIEKEIGLRIDKIEKRYCT